MPINTVATAGAGAEITTPQCPILAAYGGELPDCTACIAKKEGSAKCIGMVLARHVRIQQAIDEVLETAEEGSDAYNAALFADVLAMYQRARAIQNYADAERAAGVRHRRGTFKASGRKFGAKNDVASKCIECRRVWCPWHQTHGRLPPSGAITEESKLRPGQQVVVYCPHQVKM